MMRILRSSKKLKFDYDEEEIIIIKKKDKTNKEEKKDSSNEQKEEKRDKELDFYDLDPKDIKEKLVFYTIKKDTNDILKIKTLKDACIYSKYYGLSSQQYGPLLEKYIIEKFNYRKNNAKDCNGDCFKNGENHEIKISFGISLTNICNFNFVQLRLSKAQNCSSYILIAYHIYPENIEEKMGELYIFKVPKEELKKIVLLHGAYAHGTIKVNGKIRDEIIDNDSKIEYAIRPVINDECWNKLMAFRVSEENL